MKTKNLSFIFSLCLYNIAMANCYVKLNNISGQDLTIYSSPTYGNIYFGEQKNPKHFILHNDTEVDTKETDKGASTSGAFYINGKPKENPHACDIWYLKYWYKSSSHIGIFKCAGYAFNLSPDNSCYTLVTITSVPKNLVKNVMAH